MLEPGRLERESFVEFEGLDAAELLAHVDRVEVRGAGRAVRDLEHGDGRGPPGSSFLEVLDDGIGVPQILDDRGAIEEGHRQFAREFRIDASARSAASSDHAPVSIGSSVAVTRSRNTSHVSPSRFSRPNCSLVVSSTGIDVRPPVNSGS